MSERVCLDCECRWSDLSRTCWQCGSGQYRFTGPLSMACAHEGYISNAPADGVWL